MSKSQALEGGRQNIRSIWSRYIASKNQLFETAERCALRGWPDRKAELQNAFKLQALLCDQETSRLEYLLAGENSSFLLMSFADLSAISRAVHQDWSDREEVLLREGSPAYSRLLQEIETCKAMLDPSTADAPLQAAQHDPEYLRARQAAGESMAACDQQLAQLSN